MTYFSGENRNNILAEMETEVFDIFIIGGGITGAGIALDASTRGLKTALVEMQDFAAGTSSRSTKLVHGGLRYLKQFEVGLVAEVGKERAIVFENGPHVTTPEWMLLPIHKGGTFGKFSTSIGLRVYDFLAGVKKSERRTMLSASETLAKEPLVKKEGLLGGGYYVEYRTDDARLTIEVMKKAVENGAKAVNYSKVESFIYENGKVKGVIVIDVVTGKEYSIFAKKIINATGPWVDTMRDADKSKSGKVLRLTKGVHIVIDQTRFPLKQAIYYDTPDGRMVFAIPRDGKAYVGTTDTFYQNDTAHPTVTKEDRDYLIETINYMFPDVKVADDDIESSWAGVRPLIYEEGKDPSEISRKDEIWQSESGLITIAGGKLTGYRKMAETVVDLVAKSLNEKEARSLHACQTKTLPISGGDVGGSANFQAFIAEKTKKLIFDFSFSKEEAERLTRLYGSNIETLIDIMWETGKKAKEAQLPTSIYASLEYGIRYEMVTKPIDYLIRRTGAMFFNIEWVNQWKRQIISTMATTFNWTEEEKESYEAEVEMYIKEASKAV
ncbi:glycerol-3-phosphate dehydrogenase/oxidase [Ferdinandcohnia quinoae]|uniref:Glycerol-3-phosphate dehydrogenase n=1 Tax=Fredinandcohnia quinoae TaxID=2918902 RepID=A0AAW5EFN4_9BACI|nr:glycerol-3-phosphate dehydrogenase/oxidase [Fredinandcohnia sp. SECRCQ15]MCH1627639.1 glycerol-3-phosphate dehydrogenase/oxidase [Fredinandcohnia sp. SECRCQ15]